MLEKVWFELLDKSSSSKQSWWTAVGFAGEWAQCRFPDQNRQTKVLSLWDELGTQVIGAWPSFLKCWSPLWYHNNYLLCYKKKVKKHFSSGKKFLISIFSSISAYYPHLKNVSCLSMIKSSDFYICWSLCVCLFAFFEIKMKTLLV